MDPYGLEIYPLPKKGNTIQKIEPGDSFRRVIYEDEDWKGDEGRQEGFKKAGHRYVDRNLTSFDRPKFFCIQQ